MVYFRAPALKKAEGKTERERERERGAIVSPTLQVVSLLRFLILCELCSSVDLRETEPIYAKASADKARLRRGFCIEDGERGQ